MSTSTYPFEFSGKDRDYFSILKNFKYCLPKMTESGVIARSDPICSRSSQKSVFGAAKKRRAKVMVMAIAVIGEEKRATPKSKK